MSKVFFIAVISIFLIFPISCNFKVAKDMAGERIDFLTGNKLFIKEYSEYEEGLSDDISYDEKAPLLPLDLDTSFLCSNAQSRGAGTNLIQATDGISISFYQSGNKVHEIAKDDSVLSKKLRDDIINKKSFQIDVSPLMDYSKKQFDIVICDVNFPCSYSDAKGRLLRTSLTLTESEGKVKSNLTSKQFFILYAINNRSDENYEDCDRRASPLIVDTGKDRIRLSSPLRGVLFDIDGDGVDNRISWPINSNDMFLTLPLGGNVYNVNQLFGDNTIGPDGKKAANGFEALKKYDKNKDSVIDSNDSIYFELRLWEDLNHDAIVDMGELLTLQEMGIKSIDLNYIDMYETDFYQNETKQRSTVLTDKDDFLMIFDVWFRPIPVL